MTETQISAVGLLLASLSMIGNGTFAVFGKFCKKEPNPVLFNTFVALGVMLSSLVAIPFSALLPDSSGVSVQWSWYGVLAGVLLVLATLFSFIAIQFSGVAAAQATWSCAAIIVSVLWGVFGPSNPGPGAHAKNLWWTFVSLVLLVFGVLTINLSDKLTDRFFTSRIPVVGLQLANPTSDMLHEDDGAPQTGGAVFLGIVPALLVGLFGGSILVPTAFVRSEATGLLILTSMGTGAGIMGAVVGIIYYCCILNKEEDNYLRLEVIMWGTLSGVVWNLGNICQIIAMSYLHMPYGVSYPILQCALVVAGFWGIVVFKEITRPQHICFFLLGVIILLFGVVLLSMFGPGA